VHEVPSARVVAGKRAVLEAVRAGDATEVLLAKGAQQGPAMRDVVEAARAGHVRTREVDRSDLDGLARDHRGVVARVRPAPPPLGERDLSTFPWAEDAVVVVLDGVEDPQNLGASARSAEASGAAMLVTRTHRSAPVTPAAVRASAGALSHLPHARVANLTRAVERLHDVGFTVIGLDERAQASIYEQPCPPGRIALVVGSEGAGISQLVREHCDLLVSLPMRGKVGSLNAAASLAAVLYAYVIASRAHTEPEGRR
jgi:23S rRNA (guanosine2251-2'-O)-methyltransferase